MSEQSSVRWIDMIDPIYTLSALCDVDIEKHSITGISINQNSMTVWYTDANGSPRHISKRYEL